MRVIICTTKNLTRARRMILRLIVKNVSFIEEKKIQAGLLGSVYKIKRYIVTPQYLLLQDPKSIEVELGPLDKYYIVKPRPWLQYCRWHSGPLNSPDDPLERIYCNIQSDSYCKQHRKSERALYELCVTLHGDRGLEACRLLDKKVKSEYVVYLTDFGGEKPKVGITRKFRFLERLSEQNHIAATILTITDSIFEARRLEIDISRKGLAQELKRKTIRAGRSLGEAASRISYWSQKISNIYGIEWEGDIIQVTPNVDISEYRISKPEKLFETKFIINGYWGGFLLVNTMAGKYAINAREFQHKDSLEPS